MVGLILMGLDLGFSLPLGHRLVWVALILVGPLGFVRKWRTAPQRAKAVELQVFAMEPAQPLLAVEEVGTYERRRIPREKHLRSYEDAAFAYVKFRNRSFSS